MTNVGCGLMDAVTLPDGGCYLVVFCKLQHYFHDEDGEMIQSQAERMAITFGMDGCTPSVGQR